ncbi:His Kinase A (phospho-acceptor) domain-containing protein [Ekhidna lutea]|uniref:histidine kinase n=1 Tax=Ekhidna lutea TaxID=447679 RepID=A0A239LKI5_EKHLU|nr:ATP-binding protein [Ekhidna lutea]SNT30408.1 His Kinase A (phospho-acceptor) domain-containing protein [Ekhidna lutea]
MLKKDLYANVYILTALVLIGAVAYYVFVLQKEITNSFNQDPKVVQVAANQSTMGQQIVKAALGMGYSETQKNFDFFKNELRRVYPQWQKGHQALINGDADLNLTQPSQTDEYVALQEELKFLFFDMNTNTSNILDVNFTDNRTSINFLALRRSIEALVNTVRRYDAASTDITDYFVENAQNRGASLGLAEYVGFSVFVGIFLIQGFFIFRPLVKLASENYLSANKAFVKVKKSEQQLKINFQKQKLINKKLYLSRKELEEKNLKLEESEAKLLKSSEEQIKINERLIAAQDELNLAYKKLQDSEVEIRELADKQLQDNEKLFLAEKKLQSLLENEQKSKEELSKALDSLKGAQSQLVHSEKMASLGQLTAGIAHEINNPINFISSGMVSLKMSIEAMREISEEYTRLDDGDDPEDVLEGVRELKEEHEYDEIVDELDDLINDINYGVSRTIEIVKGLRVFSRLDEEEAKNANVNENIDATLTLLRNKTKGKIEITKHYDESMHEIECYPGQLNQVFMNILNNAVQAMPDEKKDAEITIYTEEADNEVFVRIKDNGVGIPDEIKNRIWEPFFTTKEVGVGTGLGMSITYGIIEKHGGKIELASEVGKGTEFVITLPKKITPIKKKEQEVAESN